MKTVAFLLICFMSAFAEKPKTDFLFRIPTKKTDDIRIDSAFLHIQNFNPKVPVCWRFTMFFGNEVLQDTSSCDSEIDEFFRDTLYVTGCQDYQTCKEKWYLVDFKNQIVRPGNVDYARPRLDKVISSYAEKGLSKKESIKRAKYVSRLLDENRVSLFMPSWAPEGRNEFPKVFDGKFKSFIEVNDW